MDKIVDLFLKLVQIDSPSGKEKNMILFIIDWAKKQNLSYQVDKLGNVLVKNQGKGKPILFCVHLDTVQPGEGIKSVIKNGRIKSAGDTILGADNKVALASLLIAVEEYLENNSNQKSFELLFTVKEETGGGIENFPFKWLKSKKGLVFDCAKPLGNIILSSPYIISFKTEFIGQSTHASTPEKGKNALLPAIKSLNKLIIGKTDKNTKINIGLNESKKYQTKLIFKTYGFCPGYKHNKSSEFIKNISGVFKDLNIKTQFDYSFGVSDANILNNHGIEIINLGDGVIDSHTIREQIEVKTLIQLKEIIKKIFDYS
ncbi:MAG: Peptidase T-like protein [Candidatus Roizmanbacteria bacterium GW2011_GWA2_34_18]|uniref:Peptidase T-like protein n=1 Tax=Candidatus Roizmanbacteria bacterium GW2011_GWA2_34_18 TaxID=1618477 RepID=A0A0G0DZ25_9BACT|nr:MAG: Peptidase T-like protein [Candidatus Roizmanbacteria bacterium GW2011_GWA2_34_18]